MTTDIFNLVRQSEIFTSLDDDTLRELLSKFEQVSIKHNKYLFHQGDVSNNIYFLLNGKLVVTLKKDNKKERILAEIEPGEIVGEISAISNEPRGYSVKAAENSFLLKLSSEEFRCLSEQYPAIMQATVNTLISRARTFIVALSTDKPIIRHIAIFPAHNHISMKEFYEKFQQNFNFPNITLVSQFNPEFAHNIDIEEIKKNINSRERENQTLLYFLDVQETPLSKLCFETIDMIYVVANAEEKPIISPFVLDKIQEFDLEFKSEIIFLHKNANSRPHHAARWLKLAKFGLQHHMRLDRPEDWERLSRFIRGKAIGLVLGGGGVRSWAHLGAIKALCDSNIPIDAIGGVSAGAIVAGYYALHESYEDGREQLHCLTVATGKAASFFNLTWPAISFFNGGYYTRMLKKVYGKNKIPNLWLPFFCVSCNISHITQVVLRKGLLWKAIRSSTAVPAIFPPVVIKGHLHLDGGIINNLPVDVMRNLSRGIGPIIAVELIHKFNDDKRYNFPPILPFWKVFLSKLHLAYRSYIFPPFIDTFLKSLLAGSTARQQENSLMADLLIRPDLSDFELLKISTSDEQKLMDIGYQAALEKLKSWKLPDA